MDGRQPESHGEVDGTGRARGATAGQTGRPCSDGRGAAPGSCRAGWLPVIVAWGLALGCSPAPAPRGADATVTLTIGVAQARKLGAGRSLSDIAAPFAFERITSFDGAGRTAPRVIERWAKSPDGLTWRLTTRRGVTFQDGTPLETGDIKDAILKARDDPDLAVYVCLPDIQDVTTEGDRDVVIRLKKPCYYLLDDLDVDLSRAGSDGRPVGTGPFRFVSESEDEVTMEANPHYYGGAPAIGRLVVRAYDTLRAPWAEMMRGRVDFLPDAGPDTTEFLRDQSTIETHSYPPFSPLSVVLNLDRKMFRPVEVRRALTLAVDREELVQQALKGQGLPAHSPVWPSLWAVDGGVPSVPFDAPQARALLAHARPLAFTCLIPENFAVTERLGLLVQRQLRAVGVEMRLQAVPPKTFRERVGSGDFEAAIIDPLGGPFLALFYRFWHSPDPNPRWNQFGYRDARADEALEAMRGALDDETVRRAMRRFVAAVQENPPAIFLVWPRMNQAISRRFVLPPSSVGVDALRSVEAWRLREPGR